MERCPEKVSPARRDETAVIPGRHGNLTTTDGTFETYIRSAEFIVKDEKIIDDICAHFKGAVPQTRTINSNPLNSYIELTHDDVGAVATEHAQAASDISSGALPIGNGNWSTNCPKDFYRHFAAKFSVSLH